ncbi:protein S-acyltransferase [Salvia divinorum]|uniref:Protein S-acyltransferase n=1 Tax=Salvia divinorum TaxID=28513 RepID=A0ABD1HFC3_SALDI
MAFILCHFFICMYGIVAFALILAGRMKDLQVVHILTVFLAVITLLLAGFFTYHAKLWLTNTTTNESFKWQEYLSWQRKVNEAKTSAEALKASLGKLNQEKKHQESKWKTFFRRTRLEEIQVVKNNILYLHNIYEVAVLFSTRRSFLLIKSKSG